MKKILIGIIVIAVVGVAVYFAWQGESASNPVSPISSTSTSTPLATYQNTTYHYSFQYPTTYTVQEYAPEYASVGTAGSNDVFVSVADSFVVLSDPSETYANFDAFAYAEAELHCAADGPSGSVSCPKVASSQPVTTASGLSGIKFYLNEVITGAPNGTASNTVGPFYAFNIVQNAPGSTWAALIINTPLFETDSDSTVLPDIISTLAIQKAATTTAQ